MKQFLFLLCFFSSHFFMLTWAANPVQSQDVSHTIWNSLLQKHVSASGKVNYKGMLADKAKLKEYLAVLTANPAQSSWAKNKQLAYWINAYNAFTVKLILDNYPTTSITKITEKPWDLRFIALGSKTYSLNQIENEIIRPTFKDPRIHFAVNCAAKSCPKLLNEAFTPEKLEAQLDKQTRAFINNAAENTISAQKVEVSKIFEWYKVDFAAVGGVIAFINKYAPTPVKSNATVAYKNYNWNLNE